jgi:alpha-1,2-mannosyltransferase
VWLPDVRFIIRLLMIARTVAAVHSNISDCDETFNYWEPLHLLSHPPRPLGASQSPFQTWEYVPQFAIRSWFYLLQYLPVSGAVRWIPGKDKSASFYATRIFLAICSSVCEGHLVQSIAEHINVRAARYALLMLLFSAGMFASATALLPSTFSMYATTLASAYTLRPAVEGADLFVINHSLPAASIRDRAQKATIIFACGALVAWPFALVISLPFVFEQLVMPSGLLVPVKRYAELLRFRILQWLRCVAVAAAVIGLPILAIDSIAYGRIAFVPLQIVKYNILSAKRGAGPTLYGTEPCYYYVLNLALNLGPALPLALASLPLTALTALYHPDTIITTKQAEGVRADAKKGDDATRTTLLLSSSPFSLLIVRMLPSYIWLALLSTQSHKEERFVYPAYPLLYFNAAISLLCLRIWIKGSCKNSAASFRTRSAKAFTRTFIFAMAAFSVSRIVHTTRSYRAPIAILEHLKSHELPRIVAHSYPDRQSATVRGRLIAGQAPVLTAEEIQNLSWTEDRKNDPYVDISPLVTLAHERRQDEVVRVCYGKEWYRFPTTYLVPDGVAVDFIKSDFNGILPKHFVRQDANAKIVNRSTLSLLQHYLWPWRFATSAARDKYNDLNREEPDQYVSISTCDYLVDMSSGSTSRHEPDFVSDARNWSRVYCLPFLDASKSRAASNAALPAKIRATIDRTLWLPSILRGTTNHYSEYCLLRTTRTSSMANVKLPKLT